MPSPYKYADGLQYLINPGNYGAGFVGHNFPESIAQDDGGGAGTVSISNSGSRIVGSPTSNIQNYGYGPSGFYAAFTPIAVLTYAYDVNYSNYFDWNQQVDANGKRGAWKNYASADPNTIDYAVLLNISTDKTWEDDNSVIKRRTAFNSISQINILDLVCEGPIEGFVTGFYIPNLANKKAGDIGYTSVQFQPFSFAPTSEVIQGGVETRSIFWNDVPVTDIQGYYNFQFANYKFSYGEKTNDHTIYNPYLNLYENRYSYFGRQVDKNKYPIQTSRTKAVGETLYGFYKAGTDLEIMTPKTFYVYNTEISALKINIKINALYEQIVGAGSNAGDVEMQDLNLRFAIYRILDNGELALLDTSKYPPYKKTFWSIDDVKMAGKIAQSPMIITYEITLRPYAENKPFFPLFPNQIGWAVDITKMTREFATSTLSNSTSVDSITEVYSDRFTYPDAALVHSTFDARFFSDIPARSYKMRLLKVKIPKNYDPISKTYTGPWDGKFKVAWTDNPAWCFYDLITNNRYGLGKYIDSDLTDKWTLYEISQYCDELVTNELGGLEPRFRCNVYISSKEEAFKVLNDMASIFRAIVYYSAGQIIATQDSPKDPIYLFNNSNVINGDFSYTDASKKSRKTVALVRYNDEKNNYKPSLEYVEDRLSMLKFGIRETEIAAFGCTTKSQARRLGKWLLVTQNTETELINFKAGLEGNFLKPGDVISVHDQTRKNSTYAGRTLELTSKYAVLDTPYDYVNTYAITGVNTNNSITFNVLTPTYNLNLGTKLGDLYLTGYSDVISSGAVGLNTSFTRKTQLQSITIFNPQNYLTSGSGIYSNNIRINFPSINSIPENITPTAMSPTVGNKFVKAAIDGWGDAQAYSSIGYNKNMFAEATANETNKYVMFGLNSDQTLNASYGSLDYAWYFVNNGTLQIYESNVPIGSFGTYTTSTKLRIEYNGSWINYLKDDVIMRSVPAKAKNETLYFDSSFFSQGASINANYGTFALDSLLSSFPQNTIWNIDLSTSGYAAAGINTKSEINNATNTLYPGYYLESYLNQPKQYRILNISEQSEEVFSIEALEYNKQKYIDIDNASTLVNVPERPALPSQPTLILSGLFTDTNGSFLKNSNPRLGHYTTNQGGINSIIYNIIPPSDNSSNSLYYVYVASGSDFVTAQSPAGGNLLDTPAATLKDVLSAKNLITTIRYSGVPVGNNESQVSMPSFYTPTTAGTYYFRVFAENFIGERSSPAVGSYALLNQASTYSVVTSGINVF